MIKAKLTLILTLAALLTFTGCGTDAPEATDDHVEEVVDSENLVTEDDNDDPTTDETTEEVPSPILNIVDYKAGLTDDGLLDNVSALDSVSLMDHGNIEIPTDIHTVPDAIIQTEVDKLLAYFTTTEQVMDKIIEDGDTVNIDYVGSVDDVPFQGGDTNGQGTDVTIGVTNYIDGFLAQLIGHKPGETFDIEVTFPEDYGVENLNGKDAIFAITINYVSNPVVPELTDAFVADNLSEINGWNSINDMTESIKSDIQSTAIRTYIQNDVLKNIEVKEVPAAVLDYQKSAMVNYYKEAANQKGQTLEDFLVSNTEFSTVEELYIGYEEQLMEMAEYGLILQAIAEDADLRVTDEYVAAYFLKLNGSEDYSQYENLYGMEFLKHTILQEVVLEYLVENASLL